ncbi:HD domain-containing protein [Streptomyces sp. NPDC005534]|uniref:HD-GYP domain-containing protein n=1 Tax=Streptomyces sp. NPDC005534 TaxID=3155714 RepID=UPI003454B6C8
MALGVTLWDGLDDRGTALAFGVLVAVGELARWSGAEERESAPLGAAGALAYALLGENAGQRTGHGVLQVVAVVVAAALIGCVPHVARGRGPTLDHLARRVLTVAFAAVCFQPLYNQGRLPAWGGPAVALLLVALLVLTTLWDAVLAAATAHARTRWPFGPLLRDELRATLGIGSAVCATGVVMALAVAVVGLWALPVFSLPLLLTQLSFRRYAAVRVTYRQTIASLARATEVAGYTPAGHARRVAALSRAVGRELGLSEPDLTVLEYAALMHDIGQLSLVDPVPAGATAGLPPDEQRRIALLGGAVVRQTGVDAEVAVVVERQADPYREQPVTARQILQRRRSIAAAAMLFEGVGHIVLGGVVKGCLEGDQMAGGSEGECGGDGDVVGPERIVEVALTAVVGAGVVDQVLEGEDLSSDPFGGKVQAQCRAQILHQVM